jgi:hypothetical protein
VVLSFRFSGQFAYFVHFISSPLTVLSPTHINHLNNRKTACGQEYSEPSHKARHLTSRPAATFAVTWHRDVIAYVNKLQYRRSLITYMEGLGIDPQWCRWGFFPRLTTEPCALGSTQPLKMSTRKTPGSKAGRCVRLTTLPPSCAGGLNLPDPHGPVQACSGTAFYHLYEFLSLPRFQFLIKGFNKRQTKITGVSECKAFRTRSYSKETKLVSD